MKFDLYTPSAKLQPYIQKLVVTESLQADQYKVFPSAGLVAGFQYYGRLSVMQDGYTNSLSAAGITGITTSYREFHHAEAIGSILVYFTETGFAAFTNMPVHELFNQSVGLDNLFDQQQVRDAEEQLSAAVTDQQRLRIVEKFLLQHLNTQQRDKLIVEAVKRIYAAGGKLRISDLSRELYISQSPFEKRFRRLVGTSPKKFASIVRFNAILTSLGQQKSLMEICHEHEFFDQAHFIKDFKRFTGDTPEQSRKQG